MDYLVYDIEIKNAVPLETEERIEGIAYCEGWKDFQGMGLACVCAFDSRLQRERVFMGDNLIIFQSLAEHCNMLLVGFSNSLFDDHVLAASGITIPAHRRYDLQCLIWEATGVNLSLSVAKRTFISCISSMVCRRWRNTISGSRSQVRV